MQQIIIASVQFVILLSISCHCVAEELPPYSNPRVVSENTLAPRAFFRPAKSIEEALSQPAMTSRMQSLDGQWDFEMVEGKQNIPPRFYTHGYDTGDWHQVSVPSNWQRQGFGLPVYSNWTLHAEPDEVGLYRRTFEVKPAYRQGRVILHFAGVKTAFHVYVNGQEVGYAEGAYLPNEFDITDHLRAGENLLAVAVYRVAEVSEIENFDTWRLSGIFRSVELHFRPEVHLQDLKVESPAINDFQDGRWRVEATLKNSGERLSRARVLRVQLFDRESKQLVSESELSVAAIEPGDTDTVAFEAEIDGAKLWSAEAPNLYVTVVSTVEDGEVSESVAVDTGFRSIEARDGKIRLNGRKIFFKGVNRHDWHPDMARAVDANVIRDDLLFLKRMNVNAIRTSHYPNDSTLYEMADRMGFYVMDEAAMETHWVTEPDKRDGWRDAHLSRIERLIARDRNHASVLIWSIGNEFHAGPHTKAMWEYALKEDPSRLVYDDENSDPARQPIRGSAYNSLQSAVERSTEQDRPVVMKEYAHASGNSMGLLADLWQIIRDPQYDNLHGGFIWDFKDQGWRTTEGDAEFFDWGEHVGVTATGNDGLDGITDSVLSENAKTIEVRKVYQDIAVQATDLDAGRFTVKNRNSFRALSDYTGEYTVSVNGEAVHQATLPELQAEAGQSENLSVDISAPMQQTTLSDDVQIDFRFRHKSPPPGLDAHYVVAAEQFTLQSSNRQPDIAIRDADLIRYQEFPTAVQVTAGQSSFVLNRDLGRLTSWKIGGVELLNRTYGPSLKLWRAVTDGDDSDWGGLRAKYLLPWRAAGLDNFGLDTGTLQVVSADARRLVVDLGNCVRVSSQCVIDMTHRYTFFSDGRLAIAVNLLPGDSVAKLPGLPRVGLGMHLPKRFSNVEWFGRGPGENYRDRSSGTWLDRYRSTPPEMFNPYTPLQANGNRSDVSWLTVTDNNGSGLKVERIVTGDAAGDVRALFPDSDVHNEDEKSRFEFTAIPYTESELQRAVLQHRLPASGKVVLHLDAEHAGVAQHPRPGRRIEHEVLPIARSFAFLFSPIEAPTDE